MLCECENPQCSPVEASPENFDSPKHPTPDTTTPLLTKIRNLFLISSSSRINGSYLRNRNGLQKERKRQMVAFPGTIHPYSDFRWYWDIFMTFVLLFALVCQPLKLAFYSAKESEDSTVLVLSITVAFIFFLDIYFNFHTGYTNSQSDLVILDKPKIRK